MNEYSIDGQNDLSDRSQKDGTKKMSIIPLAEPGHIVYILNIMKKWAHVPINSFPSFQNYSKHPKMLAYFLKIVRIQSARRILLWREKRDKMLM